MNRREILHVALIALVVFAFWGAVFFVAAHFIAKWW